MTSVARKSLVGVLPALCIGVQLLEVSGRWDQTFQDANDEAGIVAIVLCVGVALAIACTRLARTRFLCSAFQVLDVRLGDACRGTRVSTPLLTGSPPTTLRI